MQGYNNFGNNGHIVVKLICETLPKAAHVLYRKLRHNSSHALVKIRAYNGVSLQYKSNDQTPKELITTNINWFPIVCE